MFTASGELEVQVQSLADAESMARGIARQNDLELEEFDRIPNGLRMVLSGGAAIGGNADRFRSHVTTAFAAIQKALTVLPGTEAAAREVALESHLPQLPPYRVEDQPWCVDGQPQIEVVPHSVLGDLSDQVDVVLIVATETELDAALVLMTPFLGKASLLKVNIEKATYYLGLLGAARTALTLSAMGSSGRDGSMMTTSQALRAWAPRAAVMMGIAFGLKPDKQQLGDVLVSEKLSSYESQRVGTAVVQRGTKCQAGKTLLSRFRMATGWVFSRPDKSTAKKMVGELISGEKLVDNKDFRDKLAQSFPDAIGGEMEGAGFQAAADDRRVEWIVVKAICDWGMKKEGSHQPMAAAAAGSLVKHVLSDPTALEGLSRCVLQGNRNQPPTVRLSSDVERVSRLPPALQCERDLKALDRLLRHLPIRFVSHCLDQAAVDRILHDVFYFWEGFDAEATALDFHLFDGETRKAVHDFHRAWGRSLSHGAEFLLSLNPGVYRYRDRLPGETYVDYMRQHDEFVDDVLGAEAALARLVEVVKARFEEIDLFETSQGALENHRQWMASRDDALGARAKAAKVARNVKRRAPGRAGRGNGASKRTRVGKGRR